MNISHGSQTLPTLASVPVTAPFSYPERTVAEKEYHSSGLKTPLDLPNTHRQIIAGNSHGCLSERPVSHTVSMEVNFPSSFSSILDSRMCNNEYIPDYKSNKAAPLDDASVISSRCCKEQANIGSGSANSDCHTLKLPPIDSFKGIEKVSLKKQSQDVNDIMNTNDIPMKRPSSLLEVLKPSDVGYWNVCRGDIKTNQYSPLSVTPPDDIFRVSENNSYKTSSSDEKHFNLQCPSSKRDYSPTLNEYPSCSNAWMTSDMQRQLMLNRGELFSNGCSYEEPHPLVTLTDTNGLTPEQKQIRRILKNRWSAKLSRMKRNEQMRMLQLKCSEQDKVIRELLEERQSLKEEIRSLRKQHFASEETETHRNNLTANRPRSTEGQ